MNERKTIAAVIANARRIHPDSEVIVVANGATDGTDEIARRMGAIVLSYPKPLGHDVGRSIGALRAAGQIIVFTDADIIIPFRKMRPFAEAVQAGADIALNRYSGKTRTVKAHSVVVAKHTLGAVLRRSDLHGASLTTIPHAISRRTLETVGADMLSIPPLALAAAIWTGLIISRPAYVEVGRSNPSRRRHYKEDPLKRLIVGDHLEAIEWVIDRTDERGGLTDLTRRRDRVR